MNEWMDRWTDGQLSRRREMEQLREMNTAIQEARLSFAKIQRNSVRSPESEAVQKEGKEKQRKGGKRREEGLLGPSELREFSCLLLLSLHLPHPLPDTVPAASVSHVTLKLSFTGYCDSALSWAWHRLSWF